MTTKHFPVLVAAADPGPCLIWPAKVNNKGYGMVWFASRFRLAHRVAYELVHGPVPDDLELDHLCSTPACIRVAHLEAVTHAENQRRLGERQTACRRAGHDWTDPRNVAVHANGRRSCRECARIADRLPHRVASSRERRRRARKAEVTA